MGRVVGSFALKGNIKLLAPCRDPQLFSFLVAGCYLPQDRQLCSTPYSLPHCPSPKYGPKTFDTISPQIAFPPRVSILSGILSQQQQSEDHIKFTGIIQSSKKNGSEKRAILKEHQRVIRTQQSDRSGLQVVPVREAWVMERGPSAWVQRMADKNVEKTNLGNLFLGEERQRNRKSQEAEGSLHIVATSDLYHTAQQASEKKAKGILTADQSQLR